MNIHPEFGRFFNGTRADLLSLSQNEWIWGHLRLKNRYSPIPTICAEIPDAFSCPFPFLPAACMDERGCFLFSPSTRIFRVPSRRTVRGKKQRNETLPHSEFRCSTMVEKGSRQSVAPQGIRNLTGGFSFPLLMPTCNHLHTVGGTQTVAGYTRQQTGGRRWLVIGQ